MTAIENDELDNRADGTQAGEAAGNETASDSSRDVAKGGIDGSMDQQWWENFRRLLNDQYDWPAPFTFKFIAPKDRVDEVKMILVGLELTIRASSKGSYHSITAVVHAESAEEIIETYELVGAIDGVVSL